MLRRGAKLKKKKIHKNTCDQSYGFSGGLDHIVWVVFSFFLNF